MFENNTLCDQAWGSSPGSQSSVINDYNNKFDFTYDKNVSDHMSDLSDSDKSVGFKSDSCDHLWSIDSGTRMPEHESVYLNDSVNNLVTNLPCDQV